MAMQLKNQTNRLSSVMLSANAQATTVTANFQSWRAIPITPNDKQAHNKIVPIWVLAIDSLLSFKFNQFFYANMSGKILCGIKTIR